MKKSNKHVMSVDAKLKEQNPSKQATCIEQELLYFSYNLLARGASQRSVEQVTEHSGFRNQ